MTFSTTATETMRRHVIAITSMLLGRKKLMPGLAIAAGQLLNEFGLIHIAKAVHQADSDLLHIDFAIDGDTVTLREIILALPRDGVVHLVRRCRLAQRPEDRHAMLLPDPRCRGQFRVVSDEIIHMGQVWSGLAGEGVKFAGRRLAHLVRDGADVDGQIILHDITQSDHPA